MSFKILLNILNQTRKNLQELQSFLEILQVGIKKGSTNRFGWNRAQEGRRIHCCCCEWDQGGNKSNSCQTGDQTWSRRA